MRLILAISLLFTFILTHAQQDTDFSQSGSWLSFINPGSAGSKDKICLNAAHRQQWVGFRGAPSTSFFSADAPFSLFGANHGAAISILNDVYGFNTDLGLSLSYAYRLELGKGKLGIGVKFGILNEALELGSDGWTIPDGIGDVAGDPAIPQNSESRVAFDMGLGVFYKTDNLFFGISTTHLNEPRIRYENATPFLVRHYYATAGYILQMANPLFEVMPSFVLRSDGRVNQLYVNTNVRYNKRFWGGVSYRTGDAVVGILGVELFNGVRVGYSYDYSLSKIGKYNDGTHELTIGYCFDLSTDKSPQKYKSIRFL